MPANLENSAVATGLEKVSFHSNPKERQCQRMLYCTIALISHASKVMLKILQARLQLYVNHELPDVKAGFRKGRGGEGNGNPLHYSCLENPMDRGAWQATVHGVTGVRHDLATKPPVMSELANQEMYIVVCQ